jgi:hypothetical protein
VILMPWASNKPSRNWCYHQLPDQLIKNLLNNGNGRTLLLTVLLVYQAKVPTGPVGAWELSHQLLISLLLHNFNNIATHLDSWALLSWSPSTLHYFEACDRWSNLWTNCDFDISDFTINIPWESLCNFQLHQIYTFLNLEKRLSDYQKKKNRNLPISSCLIE